MMINIYIMRAPNCARSDFFVPILTYITGFHTGFLGGGGGKKFVVVGHTDSTCVGMHEMMFTHKHV